MDKLRNFFIDCVLFFCGAMTILFLNFPVKNFGYFSSIIMLIFAIIIIITRNKN